MCGCKNLPLRYFFSGNFWTICSINTRVNQKIRSHWIKKIWGLTQNRVQTESTQSTKGISGRMRKGAAKGDTYVSDKAGNISRLECSVPQEIGHIEVHKDKNACCNLRAECWDEPASDRSPLPMQMDIIQSTEGLNRIKRQRMPRHPSSSDLGHWCSWFLGIQARI